MTKYKGYKAVLKRNTTGTTYATIAQVLEMGDIGSTRESMDVSAYGDEWVDKLPGRQAGTTLAMRVALDPADAQHVALKTDYDAGGLVRKYHIEHSDFPTRGYEFSAIMTGYLERYPQDGAVEAEVQFEIVTPGTATYVP